AVEGDAEKPGSHRGAAKVGEARVGAEKSLLNDVSGVVWGPEKTECHGVELVLMSCDDGRECVAVATTCPLEERLVVHLSRVRAVPAPGSRSWMSCRGFATTTARLASGEPHPRGDRHCCAARARLGRCPRRHPERPEVVARRGAHRGRGWRPAAGGVRAALCDSAPRTPDHRYAVDGERLRRIPAVLRNIAQCRGEWDVGLEIYVRRRTHACRVRGSDQCAARVAARRAAVGATGAHGDTQEPRGVEEICGVGRRHHLGPMKVSRKATSALLATEMLRAFVMVQRTLSWSHVSMNSA